MDKTTKIILWVVVIVIILAGFFYAVSKKPQISVTPVSKEPIKIGAILPLSGPVSTVGNQLREGIELAFQEYNSGNIKIIFEDSQCKPTNAVSALQKLITADNVKLILGEVCSSATLAMIPIIKENNLSIITPLSTNPAITLPGNNAYRMVPSDSQESSYMADYAYNKLKLKKIAIMYENTDFGKGVEKIFRENYKGEIVANETYDPATTDYKTILIKLKKNNPDAIYLASLPQQIGLILKQAKELGINTTFLGKNSVEQPDVIKIAGDSANGVIYTFFTKGSEEKLNKFRESFKKKYNKEPGTFEAIGYDLGTVAYLAIYNSGGNKENINQNLKKLSFEGVTGHIEFDESGNIKEKKLFIKTIKNGQFVPYKE